jgi:response regulator RpfG family c-di-GMP phosphodiesterase
MSDYLFQDEEEQIPTNNQSKSLKSWRILVVDDDDSVHEITRLVFANLVIENRTLQIMSAYSSAEAKMLLQQYNDFCMAFIDVVMETDDAGLKLVEWIRQDLKNQAIRLVLRTGQAGTAPESRVIRDFDINDYKEKTDFTASKMITSLYAGIRGYRDITTIQRSLDAFKQLILATRDLLKVNQLKNFGSAALSHLLTLMELDSSALYIARTQTDYNDEATNMIIACTGKYVSSSESLEQSHISDDIKHIIQQTFERKSHYLGEDYFVGYYQTASNASSVLYIEFEDDAEHFKSNLAELYATNVALILETLTKQHEIEQTQRELLYVVGEAVEARSKETGAHVQRVALISKLLAQKLNLEPQFVEAISIAAPLHDVGKIAIPESILCKAGQLTADEFNIMKTHASLGGDILSKSHHSISKMATRLAYFHHENWDGTGYPKGLKGDEIPLEARIMAVADVFDALGSKRCYREPWPESDIKHYMTAQKGIKFDPQLINILIEHWEEFTQIRALYPDEAS